ncbi:SAE2-domain-containing protein [Venturia nashicola]|uniref:SAE2-domain-containing protein n=1 Tax=Venturia nashicola TaxID=86259 RepID=A0A4Z1P272_9PEZI|nr:SAE2-domain-containing protein [Venturia nashicola]TLD32084.1 SAE2-domain-containing protein [Venturia nashicola]
MTYLGAEGDAFSRSIANALEAFRKGVDEELRKKDELIRHLQAKVNHVQLKNDEAIRENAVLTAELATKAATKPAQVDCGFQVPELTDFEEEEEYSDAPPMPYKDHARLVRDYNLLNINFRSMKDAKERLERTARNARASATQWKQYAERFKEPSASESSLALPLERPATPESDNTSSRPSTADPGKKPRKALIEKAARSPLHIVETLDQGLTPKGALVRTEEHSDQSLPEADGRQREAGEVSNAPRSAIPSSSQATESESGTQFHSDDGPRIPSSPPVIISERVLKRKRGGTASIPFNVSERGEGTPAKPINIKSEPQSSPQNPSTVRKLNRVETLDLDEVDDRIDTPRKRQRRQERQRLTGASKMRPLNFLSHQRSTSLPLVANDDAKDRLPIRLDDGLEPVHRDVEIFPQDDQALSEPAAMDHEQHGTPSLSNATRVLHPISTNQKILPRTSDIHQKAKRRDRDRGAKALYAVAEDGNFSSTTAKPLSRQSSSNADLLDHLLDEPAPTRKQLTSPAAKTSTLHGLRITPELPSLSPNKENRVSGQACPPNDNRLPTPITTRSKRLNLPTSAFNAPLESTRRRRNAAENEETPSRGRPDPPSKYKGALPRPPLRTKPADALKVDDFKLNPKARGGLDLAYGDPVRGREARSHLEGCTDTNCANCGNQLQTLADELDITVGSHLFASTQDENLTNEERLIKFYLGDRFNLEEVKAMEQQEKTHMILQAKTKLLADRVGRHKVKPMGRAKSPPGFWNFDMPTTQQLEAQREEADARQKEVIAERRREAMRPGGRWIFRDE